MPARDRYWTRSPVVAAILLAVLTAVGYSSAVSNDFVNYDDPDYVVDNPYVRRGLTGEGFVWAWTTTLGANWNPLTWLSLQLDAQFGGLAPAAFHLTNVVLHVANTLLLFAALWSLTGVCWRSAWVAALFAVHPLHVESVAWVTERKDVLSVLFGLAALLAYAWYARRPTSGRYCLMALALLLSLLAKPMLVTLPCVFLLVDYWPLARFAGLETAVALRRRTWQLALEKVPLLVLSAIASLVTLRAQAGAGAMGASDDLSSGVRAGNALVAYATYLRKTIWPSDLAVLYPHLGDRLATWQVVAAGTMLAAITALAIHQRRRRPYLAVGWFWFVGTLVPVIGLVQVGGQALADRYTYFPLIGIFISAVWGAAEWSSRRRCDKAARVVAGLLLALLVALTRLQVEVWRNSVTLWQHTLSVTNDNAVAHLNLGQALESVDLAAAIEHYREVIRIRPDDPEGLVNLGAAQQKQGRLSAGLDTFRAAVEQFPYDVKARLNLAQALEKQGDLDGARVEFYAAVQRGPNLARTHFELGAFLARQGHLELALPHYLEAVELDGADAVLFTNLGVALARLGRRDEGLRYLLRAVELDPKNAGHLHNLAVAYLDLGRYDESARYFRRAAEIEPTVIRHRRGLEAAQARLRDGKR
ncbi:MAG TPA: tetratricopeptide repeat protein [Pirellulales bacterium]|nr:tetratricopeptide repeat protein [Pirellulales bacterium]